MHVLSGSPALFAKPAKLYLGNKKSDSYRKVAVVKRLIYSKAAHGNQKSDSYREVAVVKR